MTDSAAPIGASPATDWPAASSRSPAVRHATPDEEQAWGAEQLRAPIREPRHLVWVYSHSAIVLGRSQRLEDYRSEHSPLPMLERLSGGGAVLAGPPLVGVSVALPPDHPLVIPSVPNSYEWLGEVHAQVLRQFGVTAMTVSPSGLTGSLKAADGDLRWACFGSLSHWEVVGRGQRKLVGLAQVRRRAGMLLVAGTLVGPQDWDMLSAALGHSRQDAERLARRTTSCEEELRRHVPPGSFATALSRALACSISRAG